MSGNESEIIEEIAMIVTNNDESIKEDIRYLDFYEMMGVLIDNQYFTNINHNSQYEEVIYQFKYISDKHSLNINFKHINIYEEEVYDMVVNFSKYIDTKTSYKLVGSGFGDGDSYVLILVTNENFVKISALAESIEEEFFLFLMQHNQN